VREKKEERERDNNKIILTHPFLHKWQVHESVSHGKDQQWQAPTSQQWLQEIRWLHRRNESQSSNQQIPQKPKTQNPKPKTPTNKKIESQAQTNKSHKTHKPTKHNTNNTNSQQQNNNNKNYKTPTTTTTTMSVCAILKQGLVDTPILPIPPYHMKFGYLH
jgi:outer membrane biosynthesis protein TonB